MGMSTRADKMRGLTDGMSSRYLRGNESLLTVSAIKSLRRSGQKSERARGRIGELFVFEILKEGGTSYHSFSARELHKYILEAIKTGKTESKADPQEILKRLQTGRFSILDTAAIQEIMKSDEKYEVGADDDGTVGRDVTYRELLGGFLHPRDLRKLVTPFSASNEPDFIVRRHVMLLQFDSMRAIILRDRVLLLVPDGADSLLGQLEKMILNGNGFDNETEAPRKTKKEAQSPAEDENDTTETLKPSTGTFSEMGQIRESSEFVAESSDDSAIDENTRDTDEIVRNFHADEWTELEGNSWIDLPFELQSVDAILNRVCSILAEDVLELQESADKWIKELLAPKADVGDSAQETLRTMKNLVKEMLSRVTGFRRALEHMLEDYEEMSLMNLSRLLTHPYRFIQPVPQSVLDEESDEPEMILETYLQRAYTLTNALSLIQGQIETTEEFVVQKSDSIRNRLLYINMLISLLELAVAGASLVGSLLGMNVPNPLEDNESAFLWVSIFTCVGSLAFVIIGFVSFRIFHVLPSIL